jgi:DNA-damage-inducible protein J
MEVAVTAFVRARIDEKLKNEATEVLAELGLTVSDIVRMTLTRVAKDGAVPLELKVPNAETRAAMQEARRLMKKRTARFRTAGDLFRALDENPRKR